MRLTIGTDFSGIEAPLVALRALRVKVSHEFSSEICPDARRVIEETPPRILFGDVRKRSSRDLPRSLDIYVAGFPCQIFSPINRMTGHHAVVRRPLRFFAECLKVIHRCRPKVFILENVKGLQTTNGGRIYKNLNRELDNVCSKDYHLAVHILNTKDYGLPQNRERLFIVGLSKKIARAPLPCPKPKILKMSFKDLMEKNVRRRPISRVWQAKLDACAKQYTGDVFMSPNLVYLGCSASSIPKCLTQEGRGVYWSKTRKLSTIREELRLQGFPDSFHFPDGILDSKARKLIGNSMSVNVLRAIFTEIFKCCKGLKRGIH